jgi:hypothetical protein
MMHHAMEILNRGEWSVSHPCLVKQSGRNQGSIVGRGKRDFSCALC